jgi:peptide/nickel transport system ATP-binding protein
VSDPFLAVADVSVRFAGAREVSALSGVSLEVAAGEVFALVGESGCGKTTLAMALAGLLPETAAVSGSIRLEGRELLGLSEVELRRLRGDRLSMVFQNPQEALDPSFAIGEQIAETVRAHRPVSRRAARERAVSLLREVGIPDAERRYKDPPYRFSGGMQQRVVIATALANEPALLVADEPTTALDVTIQAQILALLRELRESHGTTIVLIAHDLGVVAQLADRVGVLYAGQLVELAPVEQIFAAPGHPYTRALLSALPQGSKSRGALRGVEGAVPDPSAPPPGCRFRPRCPHAMPECERVPPLAALAPGHAAACFLQPATRAAAGLRPLDAPAEALP